MVPEIKYPYRSLENFLISRPLTIDGELNSGWGANYSVKGCEIEASILFADISSFSSRTLSLPATATLIFVNHFITWMTAEGLKALHGIIDKYIGDEIMVVFSNEFGSQDHFLDALETAKRFGEDDFWDFRPHMGIASGTVTVGFIGTPLKYNCSVFGAPVVLAARCASVRSKEKHLVSIVSPSNLWCKYSFDEIFQPQEYTQRDGSRTELPSAWSMCDSVKELENLPDEEVRIIVRTTTMHPKETAEEEAKRSLERLKKSGHYRPIQGNKRY